MSWVTNASSDWPFLTKEVKKNWFVSLNDWLFNLGYWYVPTAHLATKCPDLTVDQRTVYGQEGIDNSQFCWIYPTTSKQRWIGLKLIIKIGLGLEANNWRSHTFSDSISKRWPSFPCSEAELRRGPSVSSTMDALRGPLGPLRPFQYQDWEYRSSPVYAMVTEPPPESYLPLSWSVPTQRPHFWGWPVPAEAHVSAQINLHAKELLQNHLTLVDISVFQSELPNKINLSSENAKPTWNAQIVSPILESKLTVHDKSHLVPY